MEFEQADATIPKAIRKRPATFMEKQVRSNPGLWAITRISLRRIQACKTEYERIYPDDKRSDARIGFERMLIEIQSQ